MNKIELRSLPGWGAFLLILILVTTSAVSVWDESWTIDEPVHLVAGLSLLQTGDARLHVDHTPLARLVAALPALFIPMDSVAERSPEGWSRADLGKLSYGSLQNMEERLLTAARLAMLSFTVLLGFLVYHWGRALFGPVGGLLPLALLAFSPPLLGNAPLVATDLAITSLIFASVYAWWRYLASPSWGRLFWAGLAVGAALATKHTAILLAPMLVLTGIVWLILRWQAAGPSALLVPLRGWLGIGLLAMLVINLVYLFDGFGMTPGEYLARIQETNYLGEGGRRSLVAGLAWLTQYWPSWLPIPFPYYYVAGALARLAQVSAEGQYTYFLGEAGSGGWPNYFPLMLLIKLSIPALVLVAAGVLAAIRGLPRTGWDLSFLLLPVVLLIWASSAGKMQIGIRHLLPVFPFLFLLTGYALQVCQRRMEKLALLGLVGLNAVSSAWVHPHYLMYFNFLAGGPDQGWRISVNGDDWGQGDRALARWLSERGVNKVAYAGFGGWGVDQLSQYHIKVKGIPCSDNGELVAFHVNMLISTSTVANAQCFEWLKQKKPDAKIGYNIFLYNINSVSRFPRPAPPANLTLFQQALDLQKRGENAQAIALYRQYLMQEPDYYQAHFNLAYALMETGQCAAAIPEFERTLALWPGYDEVKIHLAQCRLALDKKSDATPGAMPATP